MNRKDLQHLSKIRLREAKSLLRSGHSEGAYYLAGYAVECAIKACIAKQVQRYQFPDKQTVSDSYTHDLLKLIKTAGLAPEHGKELNANKQFDLNWTIVKDWSAKARYSTSISIAQARDLYTAVSARKSGVLTWVRSRW
jgi:HEPN domain-containing protein